MTTQNITIEASVRLNPVKVWEFYTQPNHIIHWNFATDDWCCPSATNDLTVGGTYSARMEAKDGSFGFDFTATYTEINAPQQFSYVLEDGRKVTATFTENENATDVVIVFDPETENPIDMQRDGWQAILNNFKKYAESV